MTVTIGCIGCGNMGAAILRGLAQRDDLSLLGLDADKSRVDALCEECGMAAADSAKGIASDADYLLIAVKPGQVGPLLRELAPHLQPRQVILSIAAGVTLEQLKTDSSGVCPVVRVMPNTPAMVGEGVFALCFDDPALSEGQMQFVSGLFETIGQAHVLDESEIDVFTAVVGSGPAYVFYFMEAVIEAGVTLGFPRDKATRMVQALFSGSAKLASESGIHPSILREMVCSPKGTTIQATNHLDAEAVRSAIVEAVRRSYERSVEMADD